MRNAVTSVAKALLYIHGKGYVHLDVKAPEYLPFHYDTIAIRHTGDNVQAMDLGSAIRTRRPIQQLTIEYSPARGLLKPGSPTMDMFALGVTLYVLLTRKNDSLDLQVMNEAFDCYVNNHHELRQS